MEGGSVALWIRGDDHVTLSQPRDRQLPVSATSCGSSDCDGACRGTLDECFSRPETTTIEALRGERFSDRIIGHFPRPFLGGVCLDPALRTSSRMFDFVFRMFAAGDAALPARGMGTIARQIASQLPDGTARTDTRVDHVDGKSLRLTSGEQRDANAIVVACEAPAAARLLGEGVPTAGQSVTCIYFAADQPPVREPILVLNGEGEGPINNLCDPSQVAPAYAPSGLGEMGTGANGTLMPEGQIEGAKCCALGRVSCPVHETRSRVDDQDLADVGGRPGGWRVRSRSSTFAVCTTQSP